MSDADPDRDQSFQVCVIDSDPAQIRIPREAVLTALKQCGFCDETTFAIKLALEEALVNAIRHGNQCDCSKKVTTRYAVMEDRIVIAVRDEGEGFEPGEVPDPTHADRLAVPNGRGIMLIHAYMDEVTYHDRGREIRFVKMR